MSRHNTFIFSVVSLVLLLGGCGQSSNDGAIPFYAGVGPGSHLFLRAGETGTAEIDKFPDRTLITDISETELGVSIVPGSCDPASNSCETWAITPAASTSAGGYRIGVSDISAQDNVSADDYIHVSILPAIAAPAADLTEVNLNTPARFRTMAVGTSHMLAIAEDGTLWGWGNHEDGQLASVRKPGNQYDPIPKPVGNLGNVAQVAAGARHSLAKLNDGTVVAFGSNEVGQLGDGSLLDKRHPVTVVGLANVDHVAAGSYHSLALVNGANGSEVYAWGSNAFGQLGIGKTYAHQDSPTRVAHEDTPVRVVLDNIVQVAAGEGFSVALDQAGEVWFWGNLSADYHDSTVYTPTKIADLNGVVRIAAGAHHGLVLRFDGTVWAWGNNDRGQLGTGDTQSSGLTAVRSGNIVDAVDIAAGESFSMALRRTIGWPLTWGDNSNGQLGRKGDPLTPSAVIVYQALTDIEAGGNMAIGMADDCQGDAASLRSWGENSQGQLGDGTFSDKSSPTLVIGIAEQNETCHRHALFYKSGYGAHAVTLFGANIRCNDDLCWTTVDPLGNTTLSVDMLFSADFSTEYDNLTWDCQGYGGAADHHFNLPVLDDTYCKLTTRQSADSDGIYTLSVVIEGGPDAGEIVSRETPPQLDCINRGETTTTCTASYRTGSVVDLYGNPANGLNISWSGCTPGMDDLERPVCSVNMSRDRVVTATFNAVPPPAGSYTLTVTLDGGPGITGVFSGETPPQFECYLDYASTTTCTANYVSGTTVTLYRDSASGAVLDLEGCTPGLDNLERPICSVTMDGNRIVLGHRRSTRVLSLTIDGQPIRGTTVFSSGSNAMYCVSPDTFGTTCFADIPEGDELLLSWNNFGGYELSAWSGCTPEPNATNTATNCRLTMDSDYTVIATFGP